MAKSSSSNLASGLAAACLSIAFIVAHASSGLEYVIAAPVCIAQIRSDSVLNECIKKFPEERERFQKSVATWERNNKGLLEKHQQNCDRKLSKLYSELRLTNEDVERLRKGAIRVLELMREAMNKPDDMYRRCAQQASNFETAVITEAEIKNMDEVPMTIDFIQHVDPDFLRDPPPGINGSYQRDRKIPYRDSRTHFESLRTGTAPLAANCYGSTPEQCVQGNKFELTTLGELVRREPLPSGDERLTFVGPKLLFKGSITDNRSVGPEERVFVLRNGKIVEAWERVQILDGSLYSQDRPPIYACERFGKASRTSCRTISVD